MLLVVNVLGELVLLLIDGAAFGLAELATIGLAHALNFAVQALLFILQLSSFPRGQLAAPYSLRDAILLVLPPLVDSVIAIMRDAGAVLVLVNLDRPQRTARLLARLGTT